MTDGHSGPGRVTVRDTRQLTARVATREGGPHSWVAAASGGRHEICRAPGPMDPRSVHLRRHGEPITPFGFPDLVVPVEASLGTA